MFELIKIYDCENNDYPLINKYQITYVHEDAHIIRMSDGLIIQTNEESIHELFWIKLSE